ncbi:MAG: PHP domain-containing protein [Solirubrobacterales bacterium]|nr:PHP domain-containing protein [Solirubrobacterales bacterium]
MSVAAGGPRFDLQSHSHHSDGELTPSEVVAGAADAGVRLLALTDHDTVGGVQEAIEAGPASGVTIVPAVEISALHAAEEDLHILGYRVDHRGRSLLDALERFREDRRARADRMREALEQQGFELDPRVLAERRRSGGAVGRPHLARAVWEEPGNADRLAAEGLERPEQVLEAYLLPGRPAYRPRTMPRVAEAIELIHAAGGVAVWAHPFWEIDDPEQVSATLRDFKALGVDGVEAFYPTHDADQTALVDEAAASLGLLTTGSSDFHGPGHTIFSRFRAFSLHGREPRLGPIGN